MKRGEHGAGEYSVFHEEPLEVVARTTVMGGILECYCVTIGRRRSISGVAAPELDT